MPKVDGPESSPDQDCPAPHFLNRLPLSTCFSTRNRPVRTRMPGGVGDGARLLEQRIETTFQVVSILVDSTRGLDLGRAFLSVGNLLFGPLGVELIDLLYDHAPRQAVARGRGNCDPQTECCPRIATSH